MPSEFEGQRLRVGLDLEVDAKPIRGRLRDADGTTRPFCGWLELIQLLELVREGHSPGGRESDQGTQWP